MRKQLWKKFCADKFGVAALIVVLLFFLVSAGVEIYSAFCDANNIVPVYMRSNPEQCYAPPSAKIQNMLLKRNCLLHF